MTLARTTSKYGDVYFCAICFNAFFSSDAKTILYGLFLGILHLLFWRYNPIADEKCQHLYVTVFKNTCTKWSGSVKAASNLSGRPVGPCRKPVQPLTDSEMAELKEVLKPLGI